MKKVLFGFLLIASCFTFGQKVKYKKDLAIVDGKDFVIVKKDATSDDNYVISSLKGDDLFYLKLNHYLDSKFIDRDNPQGKVHYFEVYSPDLNTTYFEYAFNFCFMCRYTEGFVKTIYNAKVINEDGSVNMDKLQLLSKKMGFEFSKKRDELQNSNGTNTVIIQDSRPRNGVNISIGR
ncbi:hypothetical protein GCM10022217_39970 [Chryseobacterium ginsenosidimutans]|uniref:hypothetical protein n=1 Tax=Chryseobacterium ginsenosidimutans TaxID=687846 RepID=UPI0031E0904F